MSNELKKRREELQISSEAFKRAMAEDVQALKETATGKGGKVVAAGAAVVVGFWLLKKVFRKRKKEVNYYLPPAEQQLYPAVRPKRRPWAPLRGMIGKSITAFAIALAKQKIIEYLAGLQQTRQTNGTVHNLQLDPSEKEKRH